MLKPDFPCYSPGSRTRLDFDEAGEGELLIAELRRTRADFAAAAPGRIARGQITAEEADRIEAVLADIAADLEHEQAWIAAQCAPGGQACGSGGPLRSPVERAAGALFGWEEKTHVLRRELHFRRKYDPDRVANGRLAPAEAKARLERLEAVHAKYWRDLFGWVSPTGAAPMSREWLDQVRAHDRLLTLAAGGGITETRN